MKCDSRPETSIGSSRKGLIFFLAGPKATKVFLAVWPSQSFISCQVYVNVASLAAIRLPDSAPVHEEQITDRSND